MAFTVKFDLTGIDVPDQVIYGISYNTADYGVNPVHAPGPYNSLNVGVLTTDPTIGSNSLPGTAFVWYSGGSFQLDEGWEPYSGAIKFEDTAAPEPASFALLGGGLLLVGLSRRRGRR